LFISGCTNSCARHQVNPLGFAGGKKRVDGQAVEVFEVHAGGKVLKGETRLGKVVGHIKQNDIPRFIDELGHRLYDLKKEYGTFIEEDFGDFETLVEPYLI
jgi:ferredoxin-nitrite reductase